jgi:hypothetical protein
MSAGERALHDGCPLLSKVCGFHGDDYNLQVKSLPICVPFCHARLTLLTENGGTEFLRNVGSDLPHCTVSHARIQVISYYFFTCSCFN